MSKGDFADVGVWGGPREDLRLPEEWKADVPLESLLDDRCCSSSRSLERPRPGNSLSSSVDGLLGGLCLVFSAMKPNSIVGVTSRPGFDLIKCLSIDVSSSFMSWTPLYTSEKALNTSTRSSPGITGSPASFICEFGCSVKMC